MYPSSVIKSQREQIEQKVRKVFKKLHFLFNTEDRSFDMFSLKTFRLHKGEGVSLEIKIYSVMQLDRNVNIAFWDENIKFKGLLIIFFKKSQSVESTDT